MITCWLTRREISRCLDDDRPLAPNSERHLQSCAACAQHYAEQRQLVGQLSQQAGHDQFEPSPFLRGRIVAAVRQAAEVDTAIPAPMPRPSWIGGLGLSLGAAAAIVIGIVVNRPAPPPASAELISKVIQLSGDQVIEETTGQSIEAWSVALNEPLESELQFVMNDARSAIDSLAENFIPKSLLAANTSITQ